MPGKVALNALPPVAKQPGLAQSLLYSGSRFQGHQKSKGNRYDVEVVLQVSCFGLTFFVSSSCLALIICRASQHVDEENAFLCGYLKITGLTEVRFCNRCYKLPIKALYYPGVFFVWTFIHLIGCEYQPESLPN